MSSTNPAPVSTDDVETVPVIDVDEVTEGGFIDGDYDQTGGVTL